MAGASSPAQDKPAVRSGSVRTVERALKLVEIFARSRGPFSISDLAAEAELPASTVHRLVQGLMGLGYVIQHETSKRYGLGRGIAELSRAMLLKYEYSQYVQPYLERLVAETGESASLAALYGTAIIYLNHVDSPALMRVSTPVGTLAPLHCTASGKALLADFNDTMLDEVVRHAGLGRYTDNTAVTREDLVARLQAVNERGCAVDDEEYALGARCIAVGLRGSSGVVSSALSISGPSVRVTDGRLEELATIVRTVADEFAARLREP